MNKKLTLADVVETALLEKIEDLKRVDRGFEEGEYTLSMALRNKVSNPKQMIEDLYGIIALMRQPQEPKYWPEASKKHPAEFPQFPQFVHNRALNGDSMDVATLCEAVQTLITQIYERSDALTDADKRALDNGFAALGRVQHD